MRISSPPSASSDQHDDGIESKNNLAAQCGLMDLCASMAARLSEVQAREAEREEREAEQERERAEGRGGGGASKGPSAFSDVFGVSERRFSEQHRSRPSAGAGAQPVKSPLPPTVALKLMQALPGRFRKRCR